MAFNLFNTPKLQKPVEVYDTSRSVQQNMNGEGKPSAANISAAYKTPQTQLQMQNQQQPQTNRTTTPVVDPTSPTSGMDAINAMYTSPEEEERLRKASVANQRIMAIGDALRHIGNIYHTVNYAPNQQFNNPVQEEYERYQKGKALRDAANLRYYTYQQAKAAQDQKARQWEATYNYNMARDAAKMKAQQDYRDATLKANENKWKEQLAFNMDKWRDQSELNERKFKQQTKHQNTMAGIAARNASTNASRLEWQKNKGGGKGNNPYLYAAPYGGTISLPRGLNATQIDQIVTNKDFQKYRNKTALQEAMIAAGVNTNDPAQVRRYEAAKMMQEHPEVAEYVAKTFGGSVSGMQTPPMDSKASGMNGWIAPGNAWSQPGGDFDWGQYAAENTYNTSDDDDEDDDWSQYEY